MAGETTRYKVTWKHRVVPTGILRTSSGQMRRLVPYEPPSFIKNGNLGLTPEAAAAREAFISRYVIPTTTQLQGIATRHTSSNRHYPRILGDLFEFSKTRKIPDLDPTETHFLATHGRFKMGIDVYVPKGERPAAGWPAIMVVPGGAYFFAKRGNHHARLLAHAFNQRGFAVASLDYRQIVHTFLPSWEGNLRYSVHDVGHGLEWFDEQKERLGLRPNPSNLVGISAGGGIAALVAAHYPDQVAALATYYSVFDPERIGGPLGHVFLRGLYGVRYDEEERNFYTAVRTMAPTPMMLTHGGKDSLATPAHLGALALARIEAGLETYPFYHPELTHGFMNDPGDRFDREVQKMIEFFKMISMRSP
jgi:acetyl esterase/lipase